MLLPTFVSLCLSIVTAVLVWYSKSHHGLSNDDGSSIVLFGWRFLPTLIAVLYTQLTAMLLEDVKRTEPFARLVKADPKGTSAASTILQTRTAWWTALADGFSKKKNAGKWSTALISSATLNITAFLLISPLSSSLLTTRVISIPESIEFSKIVPANDKKIALDLNRETYLRTTSHFLANVSSTDWITDSFMALPFWPSNHAPKFGKDILNTPGSWKADTMVLSADMSCSNMSLVSMQRFQQRYIKRLYNCTTRSEYSSIIPDWLCESPPLGNLVEIHDGYVPSISATFESTDRCRYELEFPEGWLYGKSTGGFVSWTNISSVGILQPDHISMIPLDSGRTNRSLGNPDDLVHAKPSENCGEKEIIMLTTPWIDFDNVTLQCLSCSQSYKMATIPITLSKTSGKVQVDISKDDFLHRSVPIPDTLLNTSAVQSLVLHHNWSTVLGEADYVKRNQTLQTDGMASVVSVLFDNNLKNMIGNPEFVSQISRLHSRASYELMFSSVVLSGAFETKTAQGVQISTQKRVVVVTGVGITLTILLGLSFFLCLTLLFHTRLDRRPLDLQSDPATTVRLATLLEVQFSGTTRLLQLHQSTKKCFSKVLQGQKYFIQSGKLHGIKNVSHTRKGSLLRTLFLFYMAIMLTSCS